MKKKRLLIFCVLLSSIVLSSCGSEEPDNQQSLPEEPVKKQISESIDTTESSSDEQSNELLPFGFTSKEYFENFANFSSFSDITVDRSGLSEISSTDIFFAETSDGEKVQFTLLKDSGGYVTNIGISDVQNTYFFDVAIAAISATDMNLDHDAAIVNLDFGTPPVSYDDLRSYVSCGIRLSLTSGRLDIQRDFDTKSDYQYIKIHSNPKPESTETANLENDSAESTPNVEKNTPTGVDQTTGQKNALSSAKNYLSIMPFSHDGLIEQLEYEGFSNEEASYAADNCGADWNEQALKQAQSYLDIMAFSYSGLIEQLEYEGFSNEEATYGVDNCNADWMEQAAKSAQNYIDLMSFSRSGLIEQLEYEGFTAEQAEYGASAVGY